MVWARVVRRPSVADRPRILQDIPVLATDRLILRPWRDDDLPAFRAMGADPRVMAYFPALLSADESDQLAGRIRARMAERGFGLWAIEVPDQVPFAGFCGLNIPDYDLPCGPCVEIGWRLAAPCWSKGWATEAARAALMFGFAQLGLREIVSFTAATNRRSARVMERIGMVHDEAGDFEHPLVPPGHPLRPHVLYRRRAGNSVP